MAFATYLCSWGHTYSPAVADDNTFLLSHLLLARSAKPSPLSFRRGELGRTGEARYTLLALGLHAHGHGVVDLVEVAEVVRVSSLDALFVPVGAVQHAVRNVFVLVPSLPFHHWSVLQLLW